MFWNKKKKPNNQKSGKPVSSAGCSSVGKKASGQCGDSAKLRENTLAAMRQAREDIGEDTIQRIAALMKQKENSPTEKAKREIANADATRVAAEILYMIDKE